MIVQLPESSPFPVSGFLRGWSGRNSALVGRDLSHSWLCHKLVVGLGEDTSCFWVSVSSYEDWLCDVLILFTHWLTLPQFLHWLKDVTHSNDLAIQHPLI